MNYECQHMGKLYMDSWGGKELDPSELWDLNMDNEIISPCVERSEDITRGYHDPEIAETATLPTALPEPTTKPGNDSKKLLLTSAAALTFILWGMQ